MFSGKIMQLQETYDFVFNLFNYISLFNARDADGSSLSTS